MLIQSVSAKKESAPSESKLFTLNRVVLAAAAVASGALAFSYFWGNNELNTDRKISQPGSQLMPLIQDVILFMAGGLPSFAFLGVGVHVAREQQRLVREETELKDKADSFLKALEETWRYSDTSPSKPFSFWLTNPQCFSIATREEEFRRVMKERREALTLTDQESAKYGNKHSNLVQMEHIDAALDLEGLEIPLPEGIASDHVVHFLEQTKPEIFDHWSALAKLYADHSTDIPFLQTQEAHHHLEQIDRLIKEAFSEAKDLEAIQAPLDWLKKREEAGDFLMIRSTGAEDSKKLANAGGNLSRSYIRATPEEFMEAVGSVVASYFGERSLQNRIDSQINPFEEPLQLAVTAQRLIGEPIGGASRSDEIPVSLVVFTNEPLYIGEEKFRVMRISASFGHGEGVVGNQGIATDTVLLLRSESQPDELYVLYDNQKKPTRLAPLEKDGNISLDKLKNPKYLVNRRALTDRDLIQIYRSSIVMESFYEERPTDIEAVVKNGIVYFVQARPVNRKPLLPTFLRGKEGSVDRLQVESLVPGKASVLVIKEEKEILFAPTLEMAEQLSAARGINSYQLIVVAQPEPQNSHPVVNFSSLGIPCLWTSDPAAVQSLLSKIDSHHSVVVCMQTASIHLWDQTKAPLEESIEEGFGVHPAKIAVSLPLVESFSAEAHPSKELNDLLIQLRDASSFEEASLLLEKISGLAKPLKQAISRFEKMLSKGSFPLEAHQRLLLLRELDLHIEKALQEVLEHGKRPQDKRLQGLFLLKNLENLMTQSSSQGVGQYSFIQAESIIQSLDLLIEYQQGLLAPARYAREFLAGKEAVGPEAFLHWRSLLQGIEKEIQEGRISEKEMKAFGEIVSTLEQTKALSQWIYLLPQNSSPLQQFQAVLQEFSSSELLSMRELNELKEVCEQQHLIVDRFSDPAAHAGAWKELTELVSLVSSEEWLQKVQQMSPTNRLIAYRLMEKTLTLLDDSLKKVKVGNFGEHKGKLFKQMLKPYFELMKSWALIVPRGRLKNHVSWPLSRYLTEVDTILRNLDDLSPGALLPSRGFSVAAAVLNAGTYFERHFPQTLEDMLTLLHQNSIHWISSLNQDLLPSEQIKLSLLPTAFKQAMSDLENATSGVTLERTEIEINEKTLTIHYNVPLCNHSGQIDLIYDIRSSKLIIRGRLLGQARYRWIAIAQYARILEKAQIFSSARPLLVGENELTFFWEISSGNFSSALTEYAAMAKYSLEQQSYQILVEELLQRWDNNPNIVLAIIQETEEALMNENGGTASFGMELYKVLQRRTEERALNSGAQYSREEELQFYRIFLKKGLGYYEAIICAEKALNSQDQDVQIFGLQLYKILFEMGSRYSAAISAAEKALNSKNPGVRNSALELYKILFEKEQGYPEATRAAEKALNSGDPGVRVSALELSKVLFKKE
jgi:hypothetical protein